GDRALVDEAARRAAAFDAALDDDLATPQALAELFGLASSATRAIAAQSLSGRAGAAVAETLVSRLDVLGLAGLAADDDVPAEIVSLAEERHAARAARDFARSDALRDQIAAAGFVVRDVEDGFELVPAPR
ncbi:MAG: cysteinyl-tRNA synthetase, partial [Gaiellaceae bacterium]|nr:cysteinyl-tRNA synthetase [Gaiellaceae bacterium]